MRVCPMAWVPSKPPRSYCWDTVFASPRSLMSSSPCPIDKISTSWTSSNIICQPLHIAVKSKSVAACILGCNIFFRHMCTPSSSRRRSTSASRSFTSSWMLKTGTQVFLLGKLKTRLHIHWHCRHYRTSAKPVESGPRCSESLQHRSQLTRRCRHFLPL